MGVMSDQQRFTQLYEARWRAVYAYLVRRGVGAEDAADLVSATFETAWGKVSEVPKGRYELAWLIATARNHLNNFQRKATGGPQGSAVESSPDASQVVLDFLQQQRIWRAVSELSKEDQELIMLVAWDEFSPAEASRTLGISRAAGRVRLHRARKRLQALLAADDVVDIRTTALLRSRP